MTAPPTFAPAGPAPDFMASQDGPLGPEPPPIEEERPESRAVSETPRDSKRLEFTPLDTFLREAMEEPEPAWLVENLVPDRGVVFLIAEPSAGKTWLALVACRAAAAAGRDVFMVEEEDTARNLADRFKKLGFTSGSVFIAHRRELLLDDAGQRRDLVARLRESRAPVVLFDPFTSLHTGDENSTEHANLIRRCLAEVVNSHPSALLIVAHHASKNSEASEMYRGRGSSVFAGFADVQLLLKHVPVRKDEGRVAFEVTVSKCRHGHRGLKRDFSIDLSTGEISSEDGRDSTDDEMDELILRAFRNAPMGLMRSAVVEAVHRNRDRVFARVKAMLTDGRLEEVKNAEGKRVVRPVPKAEEQ